MAERVVTESRAKRGARCAAEWYLQSAYRAPWKFVPFSGLVERGRGTAVTIVLRSGSSLLDRLFVERTVKRHFYPLVADHAGLRKILRTLYKKPITIMVNGRAISEEVGAAEDFLVHRAKTRAVIGAGFLERALLDQSFWARLLGRERERPHEAGLKVSTYGKVIKGGWEWLGISPKNPELVSGIVEIPELSQILTTNKSDFLSDAASLKKYYRVRKAVQTAVLPVLKALGESREEGVEARTPAAWKPITRDIESALSEMSREFPELETLLGSRFGVSSTRAAQERRTSDPAVSLPVAALSDNESGDATREEESKEAATSPPAMERGDAARSRKPGLSIVFEAFTEKAERNLLGRFVKDTVLVNTAHPAWETAQDLRQDHYHVVITVGLLLASEVAPEKRAEEFLSAFLSAWSDASRGSKRLF